jgi:hypothetical protein
MVPVAPTSTRLEPHRIGIGIAIGIGIEFLATVKRWIFADVIVHVAQSTEHCNGAVQFFVA